MIRKERMVGTMFWNYVKITLRVFSRQKPYSFINLIGLAVGIACSFLILLWVTDELSYDRFHENADQIYRVSMSGMIGSNEFSVASAPAGLAAKLLSEYPGVSAATRLHREGEIYIRYGDVQYAEKDFLYADPSVFEIFAIPFVAGNPQTALSQPNSVVLTESAAFKYFGALNPIGQTLIDEQQRNYQITGVVRDYPDNSHFDFDFLASLKTLPESEQPFTLDNYAWTYIRLEEAYSPAELEARFSDLIRKELGPLFEQYLGVSYDALVQSGSYLKFGLLPITDIHLHSTFDAEIKPVGNIQSVYIFASIALIILIISCINSMNLTTARTSKRAQEIGVRKIVGSSRALLIRQFLLESTLMGVLATLIGIILVELTLPYFNNLAGKNLHLQLNTATCISVLAIPMLISLMAGLYPALLFSSFRPLSILRGKGQGNRQTARFRNGLVTFQFTASIILLISTAFVYKQLHYVRSKDLGFKREQVIVLNNAEFLRGHQEAFKTELLTNPNILSASYSQALPGVGISGTFFRIPTEQGMQNHTLVYIVADPDFLETYGMQMAAGRFFSGSLASDSNAVILNQTTLATIGLPDALGKQIYLPGDDGDVTLNVIGIVRDFHMQPFQEKIRPLAILPLTEENISFVSIRVAPGRMGATLNYVENTWKKFVSGQPADFIFSDEVYNRQYRSEIQLSKIFSNFAGIAIFIACLGLFGLAAYAAEMRTKEIGIRKVLGATVGDISYILGRQFIQWVMVANLIAWPVAAYFMHSWLGSFAYRTAMSWWIFLVAGLAALLPAIVTISFQSLKAAFSNPVDSLHYE